MSALSWIANLNNHNAAGPTNSGSLAMFAAIRRASSHSLRLMAAQ